MWQSWEWLSVSSCRGHDWSMTPATVLWNPPPCLCRGRASYWFPSQWLVAAGTLKQAQYWEAQDSSHGRLWLRIPWYGLIWDLHCSLLAFSAFPYPLSISLTGFSPNKSLTHLIHILSSTWMTWNTILWDQFHVIFIFIPLPLLLSWHWNPLSFPALLCPICRSFVQCPSGGREHDFFESRIVREASCQLVPFLIWV